MFDLFYNCFDSFKFFLILFIGLLIHLFNKKSRKYNLNKEIETTIDSIPRRSTECPQQYPNGWLPVYDSHDLKKGEVKSIFALGRDLVIYRGASGKVYVFDAYCPHLGANLGVGGTVVGDDIKCHFHGWQFNNQGDCKQIPGLEEKAIPKTRIKKWRCNDVNDMIYVWHHLNEKEPDWFMPRIDQIEHYHYRGKNVKNTFCHIQDIVENEADLIHIDIVHGKDTLIPKFLQKFIKFEFIGEWTPCDHPKTSMAHTNLIYKVFFGKFIFEVTLKAITCGPAIQYAFIEVSNIFKIHLNINVITLGPMKQQLIYKLYSQQKILGFLLSPLIFRIANNFLRPDFHIWNRKRFSSHPTFTKLDEGITKFRRWYKQFYSLNSKDV